MSDRAAIPVPKEKESIRTTDLLRVATGAMLALCGVAAGAADGTNASTFDVWEYRVLGNSVLPGVDIERVVYPQLGPGKTVDDVEHTRKLLEQTYHGRGYGTVFVDIPEQDIGDDGVVRLKVTEGTINAVRVTGARYFSNRQIRSAVPEIQPGAVPHLPTVQAQITALNRETADRAVAPVLKAGPRPGTVDMALTVKDELPLHASLELNNQYTSSTTELRASASLSYDHLFGDMDSVSVQYQTAPEDPDEVSVWAGSYTQRLFGGVQKLAFFYIDSDSDVATVGDGGSSVQVLGRGEIFGARYINPFYASAEATHVFIGSVEYKDFADSVFSETLLPTDISYVNFSVADNSAWRGERQQITLSMAANFGIRGLANDTDEFRLKRAYGIPNYWYLRGDASYTHMLPRGINVTLRGAGQYAVDPIISNEQFSIAGADGVRGYYEAEQLGDMGFKTSLELALPVLSLSHLNLGSFLFYDYGRSTRLQPLRVGNPQSPDYGDLLEEPNRTLSSAGAGVSFAFWDTLMGSVVWAYPFRDGSDAEGTLAGDSRIHFLVRATW